jgi:hypothetical protein
MREDVGGSGERSSSQSNRYVPKRAAERMREVVVGRLLNRILNDNKRIQSSKRI